MRLFISYFFKFVKKKLNSISKKMKTKTMSYALMKESAENEITTKYHQNSTYHVLCFCTISQQNYVLENISKINNKCQWKSKSFLTKASFFVQFKSRGVNCFLDVFMCMFNIMFCCIVSLLFFTGFFNKSVQWLVPTPTHVGLPNQENDANNALNCPHRTTQ